MFGTLHRAARKILDPRDWTYLAALLIPLAVYTTALRVAEIQIKDETAGLFKTLSLLQSDLLFNLGYAVVSIGLCAAFRQGFLRWIAAALLHATAILIVIVSTCAYQYMESTGATLDYGVVAYYVATFEEAAGAVSSESSLTIWLVLSVALFYAVCGPLLVTQAVFRRSGSRPEFPDGAGSDPRSVQSREISRGRFIAAGLGAGAGVLLLWKSLFPATTTGKGRFVSRAPVPNLIATQIEESRLDAASEGVEAVNTLASVRLEPTLRTRKRHVALIHLESTRERSTTPYNRDLETMPLLAELARDSLLVEWAYTTTPHTSKAVTSVNAGLHPHPDTDIIEATPGGVPARGLPELLGEQGYRTAWFQSATETFENRARLVKNFGYDHFQAFEHMDTEGFQKSNYLGYEDDIMLGPSRRWLEENAGHPTLTMYLGVTPHHQYLVPDRYGRRRFARKDMFDRYLNNVRYDDFWVRNIIDQYKELGLYEDTIFVIYGDHGEAFDEHGVKGHDGVPYEEGLRVPLVIHDPQSFGGGERVEGPAQLIDFPPTIADMLGFRVVGGSYAGHSIFEPPEERTLMFSCRPDLVSMASIRGFEKYIYHYNKQPEEFYDLSKDPTEQNNLARKVGERELKRRRDELLKWHAVTAATYEEKPRKSA